jgi:hypothetical protein
MAVAVLESNALRESLSHWDGDLSRRFFDRRPLQLRDDLLTAAETSSVLTERLFRTMNLIDPPADYSPLLG